MAATTRGSAMVGVDVPLTIVVVQVTSVLVVNWHGLGGVACDR